MTELECHLIELQRKNMQTRGVLRRLIQEHCQLGNKDRVQQLEDTFRESGYTETAGMQAKRLHSQVLSGDVATALHTYDNLKKEHPSFKLDEFKIVDFATLLVKDGRVDAAIDVMTEESKYR